MNLSPAPEVDELDVVEICLTQKLTRFCSQQERTIRLCDRCTGNTWRVMVLYRLIFICISISELVFSGNQLLSFIFFWLENKNDYTQKYNRRILQIFRKWNFKLMINLIIRISYMFAEFSKSHTFYIKRTDSTEWKMFTYNSSSRMISVIDYQKIWELDFFWKKNFISSL